MSSRAKNIVLKFLFIVLAEIGVLYLVNSLALYFAYTPSTVLVYIVSGAIIAYAVATLYDKVIGKKPSELELEVETLKQVLLKRYRISAEEYNADKKIILGDLQNTEDDKYE